MNVASTFRGIPLWATAVMACFSVARAQTNITAPDMFNQVGQYRRVYSNATNTTVAVASLLGTTGGPQAWDFTSGPQEVTARYDYIAASEGTNGADFAALGAVIAERRIDEAITNDAGFLYYKQDPSKGRIDYGTYTPDSSSFQPELQFTNGLQDFPNSIHYGDAWQGTTIFYSLIIGTPAQITYTATDTVDAYGLVTLPSIGFLDCLRVHEVVEYNVAVDIGDGTGYQSLETVYGLNYYWLAPSHGIVVQINATEPDGSQPADGLPDGASTLERMFEAYHPTTLTNTMPNIQGFKMTLGKTAALLQWTALTGASSYTVQYTTNLVNTTNWQTLKTTTSNYALDPAAVTPAAPLRFYRVVGVVGPK